MRGPIAGLLVLMASLSALAIAQDTPEPAPRDEPPVAEPPASEPVATSEPEPEPQEDPAEAEEPPAEAAPIEPQAETPPAAPAALPGAGLRAIVGATLIRGGGLEPIENGVLIIGARRITAVGSADDTPIPEGAQVIDATGKWIVPGLIDAHVHFMQSGGLYTRPDAFDLRDIMPYEDDRAKSTKDLNTTFARYLAAGVTSVLDPGGSLGVFDIRKLAADARAPRVAVTGPLIATEPTPRQERLDLGGDPMMVSPADGEEARAVVQGLLPYKPDAIKIWGIGNEDEGTARIETITRAVKTLAEPEGVPVAVHATSLENAKAAVRGGADILVHSVTDREVDQSFISLLKEGDVTYVTTLAVFDNIPNVVSGKPEFNIEERRLADPMILNSLSEMPEASRRPAPEPNRAVQVAQKNTKILADAGVRVALGTDAGNPGTLHGGSVHREIALLAEAGLTPAQIITAATSNAAVALNPNPDFGIIKPGFSADFLVLEKNPLTDAQHLSAIETVFVRGRALKRSEIIPPSPEAVVQAQLEAYNRHDIDAFAQTYADNVRVFFMPKTTPEITGREQLRTRYSELFNQPDERKIRCEVISRVVEASFVIDQERCRGLDGRAIRARATAIYQVEDGKISRVWFVQ
ncbi:MAG: amidohydrolase family protein [Pseudomonadota bacterium]